MEKFIFDLDGTLLKKDYRYEEDYFKSVLSPKDAEKLLANIGDLIALYEAENYKYDILLLSAFFTEKLGFIITPEVISNWVEAGKSCDNTIIPGVVEVLEYLKAKDKKMVVLSNWFRDMQVERLRKTKLFDYFDEIYCADDICLKPNIEAYKKACGETNFSSCVIIGDSLNEDVLVPRSLGIETVYFCPKGDYDSKDDNVKVIKNMIKIKEMY